ncbi:hypothetical protein [uncultured Marixanthomonas sp.]|uniref:hypothetical protein n=1 Tax=uncultured Marixanthomonas sp. TaxID=757245 RepID=UPI0030D78D3F|tara:strand:+ start:2602 stop:3036 length:435 start_codon:yes stop_codon:yes gene_type:complete
MKNQILRKIILIGILIFTYSCGINKNVKSDSNSELPKELFQRWKLNYGIANGEKISGLPKSPSNDYEFKRNGEYLLFNKDETFMTGTWEYNSDEKTIYTKRDDGELNGKITDLKAESITLIPAGKAVEGTPFANFRFYYIPKNK